ncbi:nucleotidyltransferase [Fusibacter ferrireducens]|uniref:Nucleotidyltransferase n=1 Tax=Fusibacter ferrireducens TaxID=2785058 RepID=A0ABR9ZUV7_9FIRM|nr:nucleotidyltransferase [Fusibacter ferrireducens]MBF4694256.1 nucleotidyltransferase [Fusibacter ferrireducens]
MLLGIDQLEDYFREIVSNIDISESYYEKANKSYQSLAMWLSRENSEIRQYSPDLTLQGSFKLGTVIKPISEEINYDVDVVCKLERLSKRDITQKQLKTLLGSEIISYAKANTMNNEPENGKRCWTLNYHDEAQFHMDILPCVDDRASYKNLLENASLTSNYKESAIAITDKSSPYYSKISSEWEISNPRGYFEWFRVQMQFIRTKELLAKSVKMSIEQLPDYKVKTPLQKSIQILKRHRDFMYKDNVGVRPSSIIITTLAAQVYNGDERIVGALENIVTRLLEPISMIGDDYYIPNPANPLENFADKWNKKPSLRNEFLKWAKQLKSDFAYFNTDVQYYGDNYLKRLDTIFGGISNRLFGKSITAVTPYIEHKQRPRWKVLDERNVFIRGFKKKKGFSKYRQFTSGEFLNKGTDIRFEVIAENIRSYEIYWQVTNTGMEARRNNTLRGGFYSGEIVEGKRIRDEETKYTGSHFVECYIVKNDICYGKSEPFLVNITDRILFDW